MNNVNKNCPKTGRATATNLEKSLVLQFFMENIFTSRTAEEHQIDQKVCKILK